MTFDDILEQIITLLKRQGRVSYSALRRRFEIDDAYLNDLKDEILYVHESEARADERGLAWTGATDAILDPSSQAVQPTTPPIAEPAQPTAVESSSANVPEAERRQLTVMFVDLVDSTRLSSQLDPEDLREIVREYQRSCSDVITKYDGYIAQLLGDGLLVYFGYPMAHEDDPQRAVRSGLEIMGAISALNTRLEPSRGIRLAIRLGIHTGLVVVGEMGGGGRLEQLALGETPNVAARIQGIAEPNTMVISADTHQLVDGYFDCRISGEYRLKGIPQPVTAYRVLQEGHSQNRLDVVASTGLTPLVGRESEMSLLLDRWEQAKSGQGQVALLSGEAGIGKSRLIRTLREHVSTASHSRLECRCSPYFQNTTLYPLLDLLERTLGFDRQDTPEIKLQKLAAALSQYRLDVATTVPLLAFPLSIPLPEDRYPPLHMTPQRRKQKGLETFMAIMLEMAEREPLLFILEDLHWVDATTIEFLDLLMEQAPTASILAVLTCRPEFQPSWGFKSHLTPIALNRLPRHQIETLIERVTAGQRLPDEVIQHLIEKTDGVPLYVEEMTKALLESGHLKENDAGYELTQPLATLSIPATLQDSLMARLDNLDTAKAVAQLGATIGRQFSYDLLQAVSPLSETSLRRELDKLVDAALIYQRGVAPNLTYFFKHALIQDTAYDSLLRSTRQGYHRRIAEVLETQFPEAIESQPELLAHHYTETGLYDKAVDYWRQAGQRAMVRSANLEVIAHLTKGLALLNLLPDTPDRHRQELDMQMTLAPALMGVKGASSPEAERAYERALALCEQLGDTERHFHILWGQRRFYSNRGDHDTARTLGEQLLELAQKQNAPARLLVAHVSLGGTLAIVGDLRPGLTHLEQALGLIDSEQQRALGIRYGLLPWEHVLAGLATALWLLGYPEQALQRSREACAVARELDHVQSLAHALHFTAQLHAFRREPQATCEYAQACLTLSTEQGFSIFAGLATILKSWGVFKQKQHEAGVAQMRQSMTIFLEQGHGLGKVMHLSLLASAYLDIGESDEGLRQLTEAQAYMEISGERYYEVELHRLKGELMLQQSPDNAAEAETCFQQAIAIAQHQSAKSWELRSATSLARLWTLQRKRQEAYDLLAPVYHWFTEGHDTVDLIEAKALLDELLEEAS